MFGDGPLTFREFAMREPLPLATIHDAVLEFLRGRDDAVLFGAQAVNAYVSESRMTQDVDIMSPRAVELAEEIRSFLNKKFHIAVRVRSVREGIGYWIYQVRKPDNRHLVDVRPVDALPPAQRIEDVLVVTPPELIAGKVAAYLRRRGKPKAGTDWRDLAMLLLTLPELKKEQGAVSEALRSMQASEDVMKAAEAPASAPAAASGLSAVARLMAERTTQSWTQVPHFFLVRDVDAVALIALRETIGTKAVTHTDLLVSITAKVLVKHPKLNASWDKGTIRLNPAINVSIAMAVEDGVVGAVIPKADQKPITDIAALRKLIRNRP